MKKTDLLQLLNALSAWELRHFRQFLESPFFNRREDVLKLLSFYEQECPKTRPDWASKTAFEYVFPNEVFEEQKMRLLRSYLFKLLEQFLAARQIFQKEFLVKTHTCKAYRQLKIEKFHRRTLQSMQQHLEKQPHRNADYLLEKYEWEFEKYGKIEQAGRTKETNLQHVADAFETHFIAVKLKQACLQVAHQMVFKQSYKVGLLPAILEMLERSNNAYLNTPAIAIYYYAYKAITGTDDEQYFHQLLGLLNAQSQLFPTKEVRDIYLLTLNYCIKMLNAGKQQYQKQVFQLYRSGTEQGILLENGVMSRFTFTNTVVAGIKMKAFDWVELFIEQKKTLLPASTQANISNFCLAQLRIEQKRFSEAMNLLVSFNSDDTLLMLSSKIMLVKVYYQLQELEALESLLQSMKVWLQRHKNLGYHQAEYRLFVACTQQLLRLADFDFKKREALQERIKTLRIPSLREWLLEQLG